MKTSETCVAQDGLQGVAETLEAPISLTPEQLETIAAGYAGFLGGPHHIFGLILNQPLKPAPSPTRIFGVIPLHWEL